MKEYGGYLSLELCQGEEYYHGDDIIPCNSGRSAIVLAIRDGKYKRIFLPYYMCQSLEAELKNQSIDIVYYHIDQNFNPVNVVLNSGDVILIADYFGTRSRKAMELLSKKYQQVILDHTQSFFTAPVMEAYNVYSCRKFFGVSDGAYLIKRDIRQVDLCPSESAENTAFLLRSIETGTDANYSESLRNEKRIECEGIRRMSELTRRILEGVNYQQVISIRRDNFKRFHELLGEKNQWKGNLEADMVPMVYPFLLEEKGLRDDLISKRIYVPQWWKYLLDVKEVNEFERTLSEYLIPLPVDQRYKRGDIEKMAGHIINFKKKGCIMNEKSIFI